eukprot:968915_1
MGYSRSKFQAKKGGKEITVRLKYSIWIERTYGEYQIKKTCSDSMIAYLRKENKSLGRSLDLLERKDLRNYPDADEAGEEDPEVKKKQIEEIYSKITEEFQKLKETTEVDLQDSSSKALNLREDIDRYASEIIEGGEVYNLVKVSKDEETGEEAESLVLFDFTPFDSN